MSSDGWDRQSQYGFLQLSHGTVVELSVSGLDSNHPSLSGAGESLENGARHRPRLIPAKAVVAVVAGGGVADVSVTSVVFPDEHTVASGSRAASAHPSMPLMRKCPAS